ncbi:hypothetical protein NA57DRAFT_43365 [Rhizodiscina lignyota]|uniref:Uncharacterized protein n=1 Tax=Rhizodiscina lignyota TaxID=1504668 RepID=A0A9P4IAR5_9PEZI|nr:hypothetical protein NA57DRAFT_43365 [Rhizodiscina lignyota]
MISLVRQTIAGAWPRGIQEERLYVGSHEFKLKGNPWRGAGDENIHAKRLIRSILKALFNVGWVLAFSTDASKKQMDKDTLIFRHQDPAPAPREWACVGFSMSNKIRLIDCPPELATSVLRSLGPMVRRSENHSSVGGVYEIVLNAHVWYATGIDSMLARETLLKLTEALEDHGFTVYASIDQKASGAENMSENDTWHCCRSVGWQQGLPVYHA